MTLLGAGAKFSMGSMGSATAANGDPTMGKSLGMFETIAVGVARLSKCFSQSYGKSPLGMQRMKLWGPDRFHTEIQGSKYHLFIFLFDFEFLHNVKRSVRLMKFPLCHFFLLQIK